MHIEYFHASKFGNGAMVAEEFQRTMAARAVTVAIHHIKDADPRHLPAADLYVFSSPGRFGKPIGSVRRFLKKVDLPAQTPYAVLTTEAAPRPDKKTGLIPTDEDIAKWQHVTPIINEILRSKDLTEIAEAKVLVTGLKGPLEDGWQDKVHSFAADIPTTSTTVKPR
jgi:hypothetical protein